MRKIYIFIDEWKTNKVFLRKEIELLSLNYKVIVICNDAVETSPYENVSFKLYKRKMSMLHIIHGFFRFWCDSIGWGEIMNMKKERKLNRKSLLEVIRFYINAHLFYVYLLRNKFLDRNSEDIYYSYWYFWKCFAVTNHRKKFKRIKIITRAHGYDLYNERLASNYQPFKKAMDKVLERVVFASDYAMNYYLQTFHITRDNRHQIYYLGTENNFGIEKYCEHSDLKIVSCSNLIPLKRVELLIEALAQIQNIIITWTHFGSGVQENQIKRLAVEKLDGKKNVTYNIAGNVDNEIIMRFYENEEIDLFVTLTKTEGGNPVSIQEAMSFGIPVLATSVCNLPNMIDGNGILLSDSPSPQEVADTIVYFYSLSIKEKEQMRKQSRVLWENNYVANVNSKRFINEIIMNL